MKKTIGLLIIGTILTGCFSTTKQPKYRYNNGYGNLNIPITDDAGIKIPFGKNKGKIGINSRYGSITF